MSTKYISFFLKQFRINFIMKIFLFVVVQLQSCSPLFAIPWTAANNTSLSFTISQKLLKFMTIETVIVSNHLILSHHFLLLPSIFPSIRVFSNESALHIRWLQSQSFSISPSNEYSGMLSFRIDWLDRFAVQGTLKSLLQHCNSKACNPYQATNGIFQRTRKNNFTICMEIQKTSNSQSNLEKEE